jgi:hypothetical protein
VAFIPAHQNSYVGEGIHVVRADTPHFSGDILIHNNETCNAAQFAPSGASLWDVTDPTDPEPLKLNFGDPTPVPAGGDQTYHTTHSAQLFVQRGVLPGGKGRVIATLQDNQDLQDVDIFDVSNPAAPVLLAERGLEDWPGAQGSYANGGHGLPPRHAAQADRWTLLPAGLLQRGGPCGEVQPLGRYPRSRLLHRRGGNHFWGTFPHRLKKSQGAPLLLFSDRDQGLYILRYEED